MSPFRPDGFRSKTCLLFLILLIFTVYEILHLDLFTLENASNSAWASSSNTPVRKNKARVGRSQRKTENRRGAKLKEPALEAGVNKTKDHESHGARDLKTSPRKAKKDKIVSPKSISADKHLNARWHTVKIDKSYKKGSTDRVKSRKSISSKARKIESSVMPSTRMKFNWPVYGQVVSGFGIRRASYGGSSARVHRGIDITVPSGTPVMAAAEGKVVLSGNQRGYGRTIMIAHEDNLVTLYAHNSMLLIPEGTRVKRGQFISLSGNSGRSSAPHVHFEIRKNDRPINPFLFLPQG